MRRSRRDIGRETRMRPDSLRPFSFPPLPYPPFCSLPTLDRLMIPWEYRVHGQRGPAPIFLLLFLFGSLNSDMTGDHKTVKR